MKSWKTSSVAFIISLITLAKTFNLLHLLPEQEKALTDFAVILIGFLAADNSAVFENIVNKFKNLGK
jgi:hypothetical protein